MRLFAARTELRHALILMECRLIQFLAVALVTAFPLVSAVDYRAELNRAFEVMATEPMSYTLASVHGKFRYEMRVRQRRLPDGTVERVVEPVVDPRVSGWYPNTVAYYLAEGCTHLRVCDYFCQGVRYHSGIPREGWLLPDSEVTGEETTTAAGQPAWRIVQQEKHGGASITRVYLVDATTHWLLERREFTANGRERNSYEYQDYQAEPYFTKEDFKVPRRAKIYSVKKGENPADAFRKLHEAEQKAVKKHFEKLKKERDNRSRRTRSGHRENSLWTRVKADPLAFVTKLAIYAGVPMAILCFAVVFWLKYKNR